ncbi:MAG: DUF1638 domain-containing protein [Ilumatobacter sp.]|uniref:DUF1638 domain-containing protein n=1 Tax=Ilumatobacter sp. TaxID=1967498 RepID=UPI0032971DF4
MDAVAPVESRTLVIACGALARELLAIVRMNGLDSVTVECLPAALHNRPSEIPDAVRARIHRARNPHPGAGADVRVMDRDIAVEGSHLLHTPDDVDPIDDHLRVVDPDIAVEGPHLIHTPDEAGTTYDSIFVAYADCGTGGLLQKVCAEEGVEMLDGAHCYEFFATAPRFAEIQDAEIGSFYLTDFLARHFERMVWQGLGLDRHPELLPMYFGNYTRLVYLAQTDDPELLALAQAGADRLGLTMLVERTGYGELEETMVELGTTGAAAGRAGGEPR